MDKHIRNKKDKGEEIVNDKTDVIEKTAEKKIKEI